MLLNPTKPSHTLLAAKVFRLYVNFCHIFYKPCKNKEIIQAMGNFVLNASWNFLNQYNTIHMILSDPENRDCPFCLETFQVISPISGNTFGGTRWSDTKAYYPMLWHECSIRQCSKCGKYFFLEDAIE